MAAVMGRPVRPPTPDLEPPLNISNDEYIIKDYYAAKIKKPDKGEAHLLLTNKRAIIYFWTHKSILVNDAQISEVTASRILWAKRKRRIAGLIALAIGVIGISFLVLYNLPLLYGINGEFGEYARNALMSSFLPLVIILLIPIGIGIYFLVKERHTFVVVLLVKSVSDAIALHNYPIGMMEQLLKPPAFKIEGKPGPDAEKMAKEVGALILDIQAGVRENHE